MPLTRDITEGIATLNYRWNVALHCRTWMQVEHNCQMNLTNAKNAMLQHIPLSTWTNEIWLLRLGLYLGCDN